ncbi:hypothetical protein CVT26_000759 [Gymnopilus dilepis]|uniref:Uncharacterized protein n=1 Tax=Gymnopilus dilepis TaxID=231916 RepID=A0A409Y2Q3_9AGAR|nr:hypothetical protein CVT26_000759 [Gymnopilus dilepis]
MSSLILANSSSSDDIFSLADMASTFYDVDRRPFTLAGLKYDELPEGTRDFLSQSTERLPNTISEAELNTYFHKLLLFRQEHQKRLGRTLEGVHRAIVSDMLALKADPTNQETLNRLTNVLVPEWRAHLDKHVDELDALIWFETEMRKGTPFAMLPEQPAKERREDVQRMVQFAVQCLQEVNERVKREMRGEVLLVEHERDGETAGEGHLSDASSSSSGEEGDEDLFSDCEGVEFSSSDSDSQWMDVKSAFRRVAC